MEKLTSIKIKYPNNQWSNQIPIAVSTENVIDASSQDTLPQIIGSLNNRISTLQGNSGSSLPNQSEVINARQPVHGTTKTSLKAAMDANHSDLQKMIMVSDEGVPQNPPIDNKMWINKNEVQQIEVAQMSDIADEYNSSSTYAVDDIVNYLGTTYKCITAITTAENWTPGHWTEVKIADEVISLKNTVNENLKRFASLSSDWQQCALNKTSIKVKGITSDTRLSFSNRLKIFTGDTIKFVCPTGFKYRVFFSAVIGPVNIGTTYAIVDAGLDDLDTWHTDDRDIVVPPGAVSFMVCMAYVDDSTILPSAGTNLIIYLPTLGIKVKELSETIQQFNHSVSDIFKIQPLIWRQGNIAPSTGVVSTSSTRISTYQGTPEISRSKDGNCKILVKSDGKKIRATFYNDTEVGSSSIIYTNSNANWSSDMLIELIPNEAVACRISLANIDDSNIEPSDGDDVECYIISDVVDSYKKHYKKTVSILGDSISTFAGYNAESTSDGHLISDGQYTYLGNHCRYPQTNMRSVQATYWYQLITRLDMELLVNESWANSRVTWDGITEDSDHGVDKYCGSSTRIGHLGTEDSAPDIILVACGTNDIAANVTLGTFNEESPKNYTDTQIAELPTNTFYDAYRTMIIRIQKLYPLARIIVISPTYTTSYYSSQALNIYCNAIKEICDYFGIIFVDMRKTALNLMNTSTYTTDGIHPNFAGMYEMYKYLLGAITRLN